MKVEQIDVIDKPARTGCAFCVKGGCGIYEARPDPCEGFQCVWLVSQGAPGLEMPSALRPDRCGVVLEVNTKETIIAHSRTAASYREPRMLKWLMFRAQRGHVTLDLPGEKVQLLLRDGSVEELTYIGLDPETNERKYRRPL
jgi:hypothetical protein